MGTCILLRGCGCNTEEENNQRLPGFRIYMVDYTVHKGDTCSRDIETIIGCGKQVTKTNYYMD